MGCTGSKKAAEASQAQAQARVEGDFKIDLERSSEEALGLTVVSTPEMTYRGYRVTSVKDDGLVPAWNKSHENTPELMLKEGDIIVGVNGVVDDLDAMKRELGLKSINLLIKRGDKVLAPATESAALGAADVPVVEAAVEAADVPVVEAAVETAAADAPTNAAGPADTTEATSLPAAAAAAAEEEEEEVAEAQAATESAAFTFSDAPAPAADPALDKKLEAEGFVCAEAVEAVQPEELKCLPVLEEHPDIVNASRCKKLLCC